MKEDSEADVQVSVTKHVNYLELIVSTVVDADLSHAQAMSGVLAGYMEMCRQTKVNFLEFFLDEFGIEHTIDYRTENPQ